MKIIKDIRNELTVKKTVLILIIVTYCILSINQIVPFSSVDENMLAKWSWGLYKDPFPIVSYPSLFLYLNFFLSLIFRSFFVLAGIVKNGAEFVNSGTGYSFMITAGRFVNVLWGAVLISVIYRMVREFYNDNVGLFSSLLIALNPLFILHSHIYKSDIVLTLLITVSIFFLMKYRDSGSRKHIFFSSLFFGFALAAKYNIIVFPVIMFPVLLLRSKKKEIFRNSLILAAGSALGFFAGAPNWLVHPMGNLSEFMNVFVKKGSPIFALNSYSAKEIYIRFIKGISHEFGIIIVVLFISGILVSFVKKDKREFIPLSFILLYIFIFGFSGFYGRRFLLPLMPWIFIVASKTVFSDIRSVSFLKKRESIYLTVVWIVVMLFSFALIRTNLKTFNILRGGNKSRFLREYRKNHNIDNKNFLVASQAFSPFVKGDIRFKKNFEIKSLRKVRVGDIDFVQTNDTFMEKYFKGFPNGRRRFIDLGDYRKFFSVHREKYQDWDDDYSLFYRQNISLKNIYVRKIKKIPLPYMYYNCGNSSMLPAGIYEKKPGLGLSSRGYYSHRIYSSVAINRLKFNIFFPGTKVDLMIKVNGKKTLMKSSSFKGKVYSLMINDLKPGGFEFGYVYSILIEPASYDPFKVKQPNYLVVFDPVYKEARNPGENINFTDITDYDDIPNLFSEEPVPEWIKKFYSKYGIDMMLYRFVMGRDMELKGEPFAGITDFYPLKGSHFIVVVKGDKLIPDERKSTGTIMAETYNTGDGYALKTELFPRKNGEYRLDYNFRGLKFVRFTFVNFRKNNFLIKRVSIFPDIISFIKNR